MAYFNDADDVYATLGRFLTAFAADPEAASALRRADTTLQLRLRQPDCTVTLRTPQDEQPAQVDCGDTTLQPEVVLQMNADDAHRFWLGRLNIAVALARGDVRARGPSAKILTVVPLVKPALPRYRATLEAAGREDLLGAA